MTKNGGLMFVGRENELKILNRVFLSNRQESVQFVTVHFLEIKRL